MSLVDYEMAERTSKLVLEYLQKKGPIPNYIFQNLLTSTICLTLDHEKLGPNLKILYYNLEAAYRYGDVNELEAFNIGAIYGTTQFYKEFQKVKRLTKIEQHDESFETY